MTNERHIWIATALNGITYICELIAPDDIRITPLDGPTAGLESAQLATTAHN